MITLGDLEAAELTGKEITAANQAWLDQYIAARSAFRLATPIATATDASGYTNELIYLFEHGYLPDATGTLLLPPP